jgi:hypothetical protein
MKADEMDRQGGVVPRERRDEILAEAKEIQAKLDDLLEE